MPQIIDDDTEIAYTVGHSTHTLDGLVAIVRRAGAEQIVDVRRFPGSRRMPHFGAEALRTALGDAYVHIPDLGGFRKPRPDSPNGAWENASFRGYADYMQTPAFEAALEALLELDRPAVMCAEAQWTRCHRRLISDALVARGRRVVHIRSDGRTEQHELTPWALVDGTHVSYPPRQAALDI